MWRAIKFAGATAFLSLACGACATPPQVNSSMQMPQALGEADWQTVSTAGPGEASQLRHRCHRISNAEAEANRPMALTLRPIAVDDTAWRGLGALEYRGQGVEVSSDDPRFASLAIEPGHVLPRLPNGDFIQVDVCPVRAGD